MPARPGAATTTAGAIIGTAMRILLATYSLEGFGGSETYVVTVADQLQRLGHEVWLHSPRAGRGSELAEGLGVRVAASVDELRCHPEVLVVQDGVVACELAAAYPLTPQVFVAHSDIFDLQLPPSLPGLTSVVVALYDRVERRIRALALDHEVARLSQPVDVERFKPSRPLGERPRVALAFGNYMHGERLELVRRACERAGIELRHVGVHGHGLDFTPQLALNQADVVIGKARVIVEAMACGRAAYVFDHNGGEGWVTAESYPALAADNFGGQGRPAMLDHDRLLNDLLAYDAGMGIVNRDLAVAHHSATKHAAALVEVLLRVVPRQAPVDAPLGELARMVRLYHRADVAAFGHHAHIEGLWRQIGERESEIASLEAQRDAARSEREREIATLEAQRDEARSEREREIAALETQLATLDAQRATLEAQRATLEAQRDAARQESGRAHADVECVLADLDRAREEADHAQRALAALAATRRWRTVQAIMRPLDRLRIRA